MDGCSADRWIVLRATFACSKVQDSCHHSTKHRSLQAARNLRSVRGGRSIVRFHRCFDRPLANAPKLVARVPWWAYHHSQVICVPLPCDRLRTIGWDKSVANPIEIRAFRISALGFLIISVLGIVFAILAKSQAILLDGVYALVSVLMTVLAAQVARLVEKPSSPSFHFGYAHFEPLLNLIRGLLIFGICAYGLLSTIDVLVRGGRRSTPRSPSTARICYGASRTPVVELSSEN